MLRLLHTSDWHLGQTLHDRDREAEHRAFFTWLVEIVGAREIDALLVAGDVFDGVNPPAAAQRLLFEALGALRARRPSLQVVLVAGNHDSPARLEAPAPLGASFGVHLVGAVPYDSSADALERLVLPLSDSTGEVRAWCLAVPFVRPAEAARWAATGGEAGATETTGGDSPEARGLGAIYARAAALARARRLPDQALVALGHLTVRRGAADLLEGASDDETAPEWELNESVRDLSIGGQEALSVGVFPEELAYVALGHLHRAGPAGGRSSVRYSGSPFPLSFAERGYRHQVVLVELEGAAAARVEPLEVPRPRPMWRVPSAPAPLEEVIAALRGCDWSGEAAAGVWVELAVQHDGPLPADVTTRLAAELAGRSVLGWRILPRRRRARAAEATPGVPAAATLEEVRASLDPRALLAIAWRRAEREGEPPPVLLATLDELLAEEPGR